MVSEGQCKGSIATSGNPSLEDDVDREEFTQLLLEVYSMVLMCSPSPREGESGYSSAYSGSRRGSTGSIGQVLISALAGGNGRPLTGPALIHTP